MIKHFLFFRFRSYSGLISHGFKIIYERQECPNGIDDSSVICSPYCSETYTSVVGTVTFPAHPRNSITRYNCVLNIIQEQGSIIKIKELNMNITCGTAFLEIRDGPYEDSPLMGRFCDEKADVPTNFQSSQNHIFMR